MASEKQRNKVGEGGENIGVEKENAEGWGFEWVDSGERASNLRKRPRAWDDAVTCIVNQNNLVHLHGSLMKPSKRRFAIL